MTKINVIGSSGEHIATTKIKILCSNDITDFHQKLVYYLHLLTGWSVEDFKEYIGGLDPNNLHYICGITRNS